MDRYKEWTMEALRKKRADEMDRQDVIVVKYIKNEQDKEEDYEKKRKQYKRDYEEVRERILDVEDEIARRDPELMDELVEPNQDEIENAVTEHYTREDWKRIGKKNQILL